MAGKKTKAKRKSSPAPVSVGVHRTSVSIQKASNGFIVSSFDRRGNEKIVIATDAKKAKAAASKMIGL